MLCRGLQLPYQYSGLLCETLLAAGLALPAPVLPPAALAGLLSATALLRPDFPKYLAGCMRQIFLRLGYLDPALARSAAQLLGCFITNMGFRCVGCGVIYVMQGGDTQGECTEHMVVCRHVLAVQSHASRCKNDTNIHTQM